MPPDGPSSLQIDPAGLAAAVDQAKANAELLDELAKLHTQLDAEIAALNVRCWGSGACCRFDQAGHRLFVSTAELAYLLVGGPPPAATRLGRCPYQIGPRCTARDRRPIGCRIYFCDDSVQDALGEIYSRYHRRICQLHSRISLVYHYVELTAALASLAGPIAR